MVRLGSWSAAGAAAASIGYGIPQLLQVMGWLHDPLDRILIFAPSLALAPLFVLALAGAYEQATAAARIWRLGALALGLLYAACVGIVYVVQLGAVIPADMRGTGASVAAFACCSAAAPMAKIDLLGYTYMSLATLLLAPSVGRGWLRWLLIVNGVMAPLIFFQILWPQLIYAAAAWLVVFPAAMILLAVELARNGG
ncbi:MAG: hypothetical protein WDN44_15520 [Sphingomonas sp.]